MSRVVYGGGAIPIALAATVMAGALVALPGPRAYVSAAANESIAALMQKRSPGERRRGDLIDTKARRDNALGRGGFNPERKDPFVADVPTDQSASPGVLSGTDLLAPFQGVPLPDVVSAVSDGAGALGEFIGSGGGGFFPGVIVGGGGGGGSGGGSGGGGGGGGGSSGGEPTAPPVVPVPEPASWLMLVFGFGIVGHALRNQRTKMSAAPRELSRASVRRRA